MVRWLVILCAACGSTPPSSQAPSPSPPVASDATPIDASEEDAAAPVSAEPPVLDTGPPPVLGTTLEVTVEESATARLGHATVVFTSASHKIGAQGPGLGTWRFTVTHGGTTVDLELRSETTGFQAEVVVGGGVFVFEAAGYTEFRVWLLARGAPVALDVDGCVTAIEASAAARDLPEGAQRSASEQHGVVIVSTPQWRGLCGRYTGRVWFYPPVTP